MISCRCDPRPAGRSGDHAHKRDACELCVCVCVCVSGLRAVAVSGLSLSRVSVPVCRACVCV